MAIVRFKRGAVPQTMDPDAVARLNALTEGDIVSAASTDPDNPIATDEEMERAVTGRNIRLLRHRMGLDLEAFAHRFHFNAECLRDWEEGKRLPDGTVRAYLRVIAKDPRLVEGALATET
ncbi:transcriptional regulator [uncultured Alsobacter sp.]|uniref:helix-turn-helix domain-containing protein n=1 Tax=uncultured Alsobacter sp. TaxID=1748258 RepID=UPI0025E61447|nr:transcriptional regulator [uncultured Alsobacter sp.]